MKWDKDKPGKNIEECLEKIEEKIGDFLVSQKADCRISDPVFDALYELKDLASLIRGYQHIISSSIAKAQDMLVRARKQVNSE